MQDTAITLHEVDEAEIREKAKIFIKTPLKPYHQHVNDVAGDICVQNPAMLSDKGELLVMARKMVHESGFQYKKKRSRSKSFGSAIDVMVKRPKVNKEMRTERITQINEELKTLNTQLGLRKNVWRLEPSKKISSCATSCLMKFLLYRRREGSSKGS